MLKKIVDKLEDVDEKFHDLYEKKADGKFHLKVEDDNGDDLKRAKDREKEARKAAEQEAADLREKLKKAEAKKQEDEAEAARKAGDIKALEESWGKKLEDSVAEKQAEIDKLNGVIKNQMVDTVALELATELSEKSPKLLLPHIQSRLSVEISDGKPITRVLDKDGKPSAMNVDDLKKEFFTNEDFSEIITGSKASGGGATGAGDGKGGARKTKWADFTTAELVEIKNKDRKQYDALLATREGIVQPKV